MNCKSLFLSIKYIGWNFIIICWMNRWELSMCVCVFLLLHEMISQFCLHSTSCMLWMKNSISQYYFIWFDLINIIGWIKKYLSSFLSYRYATGTCQVQQLDRFIDFIFSFKLFIMKIFWQNSFSWKRVNFILKWKKICICVFRKIWKNIVWYSWMKN